MVLAISVAALLLTLAVWVVAKVAERAMRRLAIEPISALLWLGLAERQVERSSVRRLRELLAEPPAHAAR